ncbi:ABC transporter substrate-binding protein [Limobrevibacterium gyesilva]|uniref:Extracellular solute-binding protein n=1 Tax=Limobrevibacterium gyesilva TaxID=2991712 RepID=A0AA41YMA8_9PROT|nr:extracellular solute-binding protein [Limobrevibacterium gyesilva]MCW3476519.1 extracellular solute-binding protein [Limobrevibacterium gyesilva]
MDEITRRGSLALGAGALATAGLIGARPAGAAIPVADVPAPKQPIEAGATLRVIRPTKFVDPDETIWNANTEKFTKATGVPVRVDFVGWEDLRPQVAVAARTGAGPDVVVGWANDPHLYSDKILDMTELATYLGKKYGGWGALPQKYGKKFGSDTWIALPMGCGGGALVWRKSWVNEAGYSTVPDDLGKFLDLCQKLKKNGHPPGFALGNAVGDGNGTATWLLWAHGGYQVDDKGQVAINRKETIAALKYGAELYKTFIPGTLSWLDPSNNKAYIAEEISLTQNGVSIYFVAKNDPKTAHVAADTEHSRMPGSLNGKAPEAANTLNAMVFKHTKFPNAAKEYLRFMMEAEQYDPWLTKCLGYWAHPLLAFDQSDCWKSDPKIIAYRDAQKMQFWDGYKGPINAAAAAVSSEYVLVQMFAGVASGQQTPEDGVKEAERRLRRIYKS